MFTILLTIVTMISLAPVFIMESIFNSQLPLIAGFSLTCIQLFLFSSGAFLQPILIEVITIIEEQEGVRTTTPHISTSVKWNKNYVFFFCIGILFFTLLNTSVLKETVYQPVTKVIAHRGYAAVALENTIASLEAAAEAGAEMVEMDIQETKDGKFVVYHDKTLSRLSKSSATIGQSTLAQLTERTISNGSFTEPIPSFEAFIDRAKELDIRLLVETKTYGHESPQMEENLLALLREKEVIYTYIIQSLDIPHLHRLQEMDPLISTSDIIAMNVGRVPTTTSNYLSLEDFSVTPHLVQAAQEQQKGVFVWTVNKEKLMHYYMRMGVEGIITNHVEEAIAVRDVYEEEQGLLQRIIWLVEQNTNN